MIVVIIKQVFFEGVTVRVNASSKCSADRLGLVKSAFK